MRGRPRKLSKDCQKPVKELGGAVSTFGPDAPPPLNFPHSAPILPAMPRYDAYVPQSPSLSPQKGWIITALTGSLVVHVGLYLFFRFQTVDYFTVAAPPPAKQETIQRVKVYEEKKKKPDEIKTVLPEKKSEPKKELVLPTEQMKPDEITVSPKHNPLDSKALFGNEKPTIELAKNDTAPASNVDNTLTKLPDSMFNDHPGPKIIAKRESDPGPDGDGASKAIQVAGNDVEGILNGLTNGTGAARRLSLPGNLTFAYDSADISDDGRREMEKIAEAFRKFLGDELRSATFIVEGHTDPTGTPEYNHRLSERRAESVKAWLVSSLAIDPSHVQTIGYGATRPVEGVPLTGTVEELQGHRRTEIVVRRAKKP
jgi:outer membrane protein OmpA-like peptidoglycan-associated protein